QRSEQVGGSQRCAAHQYRGQQDHDEGGQRQPQRRKGPRSQNRRGWRSRARSATASPTRGPARDKMLTSSTLSSSTRSPTTALRRAQPGLAATLAADSPNGASVKTMKSGSDATTYSGFTCGKSPMAAVTMLSPPAMLRMVPR